MGAGSGAGIAYAQGAAPQCAPAATNNSALQAGAVTVSPLPGSRDASPRTQISFLGLPMSELKDVSVVGQRTGTHPGRLEAYSQGDGASFLPDTPFSEGERVSVHATVLLGGRPHAIEDTFRIETIDPITHTPAPTHAGASSEEQHFLSRPDLQPPLVSVTAADPSAAGDVFLAPYAGPGQAGPMIVEPDGQLVWFKPLPANTAAANLRVQSYEGRPVLTWWQGDVSVHGFGLGEDVLANSAYTEFARVRAGNGYAADLHEFQLTPTGSALLTAYDPIRCDLASVGGSADGAVTDSLVQEIDVRTGLVMFEWTSLDHVPLSESYEPASHSSSSWPWDYFHVNSINPEADGDLLISSRNTWAVYDVEPASGQVRWQLGGRHDSFSEPVTALTAWQHDASEVGAGVLSIFDNGSAPTVHKQSRALVLDVDPAAKTASLLAEFTHTPAITAESEGNVQLLPDGDWFVGWGQEPYFSEYSPQGTLLLDAHMPRYVRSYRDVRYPWWALPNSSPSFVYVREAAGAGSVAVSWNGATGISAWQVLAGASPKTLRAVAQGSRTGFETRVALPGAIRGPYLAVQALGAGGRVLRTAPAVRVSGL